jgi:multidrug efflux pump subunit AcrA (membrane-fusion protein)
MSTEQSSVSPKTIEDTKRQIRGLVNEIAQLSKSDLAPEQYYAEFLPRIVQALAAVGGAIWNVGEGGRLELAYQINISRSLLDPAAEDAVRHVQLLGQVIQTAEPRLVSPQSGSGEGGAGNPTNYLLVLSPMKSENHVEGILEVFQRPDVQPASQRGYLQFVVQMCELAGDWLRSQKLRQYSDRQSLWVKADRFSRLIHENLSPKDTAYHIANEGRQLIGCDRLSVAVLKGRKCKVEAVSGQDVLDPRSDIVSTLGKLATMVVAADEPLWYSGSTEDLPKQIERALDDYLEVAHSKSVAVLPLRRLRVSPMRDNTDRDQQDPMENAGPKGEVIGALIVEQIESNIPRATIAPRVDLVYEHSSRAMANALSHEHLFLMPVWRTLGNATWILRARTLPKTLFVTAVILAALAVLIFVPKNFNIEGDGELVPVDRQDVFCDVPGVVEKVLVKHGQEVEKGQELLKLRNTDLEVQLQDVFGKMQTTNEALIATRRARQQARERGDTVEMNRMAGQILQYQQQLDSYTNQYQLLSERRERLTVRSPMKGEITTWQTKELLLNRPVTEGQVLLTVADPASKWKLEVFMRENRMGHIMRAWRESQKAGEPLDVTYILATDSDHYRHGVVREIHQVAHMREQEHVVRIDVDLKDPVEDKFRRTGAQVRADIHAGRRPIGYVWFHEAWEWFLRDVWF